MPIYSTEAVKRVTDITRVRCMNFNADNIKLLQLHCGCSDDPPGPPRPVPTAVF